MLLVPPTGPVAPFTGAWIETVSAQELMNEANVAPFTGAWIETLCSYNGNRWSNNVAPFTGAWIETLQGNYEPRIN